MIMPLQGARAFADRVVVITGSSRGIGLGIARAFAEQGAILHLLADDPQVETVAAELGGKGYVVDITEAGGLPALFATIGRIDVLINNAGYERLTPLDDPSADNEAVFRRIIDINVTGTFMVTRAALPMLGRGSKIINTASVWARTAEPLFSAYVASKHAVIGLTKTWAKELGPHGINVNAVCPGWVRTEAALRSLDIMAARSGVNEGALLDDILKGQALPGLMEPADIAGTYLFLASDLATNVTGQGVGADRGEAPL